MQTNVPVKDASFSQGVKRILDTIVAAICLIVFSPLWLVCWIMVKIEDGGSVLYKQERIGYHGRPFNILKFRTMRVDAENNGPQLSKAAEQLEDTRLTKVGRFLRAHHLDELPQLWNVFVGDMAFVGPRPERQYFIDKIMELDDRYPMLYRIRPGVTSYATLYNGYCDSVEKMVTRLHYDLEYLDKQSFWLDTKILWLTFIRIIFGCKF